jgi:hypothetical protein
MNRTARDPLRRTALAFAILFLAAATAPVAAQSSVSIVKATNGQDANSPPGPVVTVGSTVTWTYEVTAGGRDVSNIAVTDDQGVTVTCPFTSLLAGTSMTCTASGIAVLGQNANIGTVNALEAGVPVSASDPSHYYGQPAGLITLVKATNGQDANLPPGPVLAVGAAVNWTYVVTNTGTQSITNVAVTDDQGVTVTCPFTSLSAGSSMTCTASGTAQAGQYTNVGIVTATHPVSGTIVATDPSHYFGQSANFDFGDAPDSYGTTFASNGARHVLGTNVYLGACVDAELDGQPSAGANGDDTNVGTSAFGTCAVAGADEDGVTFNNSLRVGQTASITVVANASCTLSAWIDFNANGNFSDSSDNLFPGGTVLVAGSNSLTFTVPSTAVAGATYARFRCTTDGVVGPVGPARDGEVEDYKVTIVAFDFGDAPDSYGTTLASNGARHVLGTNVYLGACVDAELNGQPSAGANGDDTNVGTSAFGTCAVAGADEDGVTFNNSLRVGQTASITVVANASCTLSAWIDFNANGNFSDSSDNLFPGGTVLVAGSNSLTFTVPSTAVAGAAYARFRCTTDGVVGPVGAALDGEVEDYKVTILTPPVTTSVPTLSEWGLVVLSALLVVSGLFYTRRRKRVSSALYRGRPYRIVKRNNQQPDDRHTNTA